MPKAASPKAARSAAPAEPAEPAQAAEMVPARRKKARAAAAPSAPASEPAAVREAAPAPERRPSVRLHKFLAHGGAGSRREAETFIEQGRVSVNGKVVAQLGFKVDPALDRVLLDGEPIQPEERVYFLLHKPAGFVCTNHDERGRPRAVDLLRGVKQRIYTVGRLDVDSLGLILVTNDGDLANIVCHPRYRIQKRYQVAVKGFVTREQITKLEAGVWLAEGKSSPAKVVPLGRNPRRNETILEMTIFEGRNREIRRVFAGVGLNVRRLLRISIGPIDLAQLQPGETRQVQREDLAFVDEARRLYEANKEAWDAELPPPKPKVWRPRPEKARREGRRGGFQGPPRGGFGGPRRGGGFGGPRGGGGYGAPRGGGDYGPARREGDYGPPRRSDEGPARREGGYGDRPPFRRPFDGPPGGGPRRPRPHY
jgi:pseudouridine synthase